eukprot:jgi/Botrbrau1/9046/Bobra.0376s0022.1
MIANHLGSTERVASVQFQNKSGRPGFELRCLRRVRCVRRPQVVIRSTMAEAAPLYDRIGGKEPVKAVTSLLFDKLIEDPDLGHYFQKSTLGAHKVIVSQFLAGAFGGPKEYKGRNMVDAHVGLPGFEHPKYFNIVASLLQESLNELNVPKELGDEVMTVAASLEPEFARVAQLRKVIDGGAS